MDELKAAITKEQATAKPISTQVINLFPLQSVLKNLAQAQQASMVVMGLGEAKGLQKRILNSTTIEVLENVNFPVLVIPKEKTFSPIKHILIAIDFTTDLPNDIELVFKIAQLFDSEITFLPILSHNRIHEMENSRDRLHQLSSQLSYQKITNQCYEHEDIEEGINEYAIYSKADLLVMITHTHTFWQRLFESSHVEKIIYNIGIPLLSIHSNSRWGQLNLV